jgi:hypothetical protein
MRFVSTYRSGYNQAMSELERLHETLRRMHAAHHHTRFRVGRNWYLHAGYETRSAGEEYSWHGERRGGDPRYPLFHLASTH